MERPKEEADRESKSKSSGLAVSVSAMFLVTYLGGERRISSVNAYCAEPDLEMFKMNRIQEHSVGW